MTATPRPPEHIEPSTNPTTAIRSILPALPPAERRVAEGILAQPADIVFLSISDLATRASTSEATVVRLCQRAGFAGYPEMRLAMATQVGRSAATRPARIIGTDIAPDDPLSDIVAKVGSSASAAISDTVEQLDIQVLEQVTAAIAAARRVEIYGIGASGLVALDLEHKLRRIGLPAAASVDGHLALTSAAVLTPDDLVIGLSHSGETLDVIDPLAEARARGATAVAITNYPRSSLAKTGRPRAHDRGPGVALPRRRHGQPRGATDGRRLHLSGRRTAQSRRCRARARSHLGCPAHAAPWGRRLMTERRDPCTRAAATHPRPRGAYGRVTGSTR